jgi:hypothetical protein
MLFGLVFGKLAYRGAVVWTGAMASFFMLKTLANNYSAKTPNPLRMPILWGVALMQFASIW